ncbi:MAG: hypothetical protein EPN36_09475 [Rhodanobacteraceae bacterium]|nr:MAG: hypothetical protein EPN36_09475 [Rhodanobacteraceae bacterium]
MTLDSEQGLASSQRTTAAGLEAWLSGVHAEPAALEAGVDADIAPPIEDASLPPVAPIVDQTEAGVVGPVNAAEAVAMGMATTARKLVGPDGAELVIDPERHAYHFESTSLKPLLAILQQSAKQWAPVYSEALNAARASHPAQPLERLLWFAGLVATPGILGRQLSRGERYKLTRWPETEREFPKHFRIAKEMVKEPATADQIVAASGMPYEEVVDYMNASHAAGRLAAASTEQATTDASQQASRGSRLMARLNKPLFAR